MTGCSRCAPPFPAWEEEAPAASTRASSSATPQTPAVRAAAAVQQPRSGHGYRLGEPRRKKVDLAVEDLQLGDRAGADWFGRLLLAAQCQIGFVTAIDGRIDRIVDSLAVAQYRTLGHPKSRHPL